METTAHSDLGNCADCGVEYDLGAGHACSYSAIAKIEKEIEARVEAEEETTELSDLVEQYGAESVAVFVWNLHNNLDQADDWADDFRDSYVGEISIEDHVEEMLDEGAFGDVPADLRFYIDAERIGRDLLLGDYWTEAGHLFRSY
jgi:hypothetical protein